MLYAIRTAFEPQMRAADCIEIRHEADVFVHDPPAPSRAPCEVYGGPLRSRFDLHIVNQAQKPVAVVLIDKCVYEFSKAPSRCDCAVVVEDRIHFVEFKKPDRERSSGGNDNFAEARDCIQQLATSINDFYDRGIIAPGTLVHAYACVGYLTPRRHPGSDRLLLTASLNRKLAGRRLKPRLIVDNTMRLS